MTTVLPPLLQWAYRPPANLPQTALGALFTVSGGPVWAVVVGRVTTGLGASASLVKLVADPTLGTDSDLSATAGFSMTGLAADVLVTSPNSLAVTTMFASAADAPIVASITSQIFHGMPCAPGSISLNATGNQTGQMEWWCGWIPLVPGAVVVAV